MRPTLWTIGILTVPSRQMELTRIRGMLRYQIDSEDLGRVIEIRTYGGTDETISEKRQRCLDEAVGQYVNFVDDDDLVAHNYIRRLSDLMDGVDYIGFRMQHYLNGVKSKPTFHSLRYPEWSDDANGYYRNVSHLNPMRTEIARQGRFDGGYGEDARWAQQVNPQTEHYIDDPMYYYFDSPRHSLSRRT